MKMTMKKTDVKLYESEIFRLLDSASCEIKTIKPSEWAEKNRIMTSEVSSVEGPFKYYRTPYTREIVDCLATDHPARKVAVMKGAQIGFTAGVIENGIGWIIENDPGNILYLVGHDDVLKATVKDVDSMLDGTGTRKLIKSTSNRVRNTKSGDTDKQKEFSGGSLKIGITNHKSLRNMSLRYIFVDDFESMESETNESGSTTDMIQQRAASFKTNYKILYISTPELEETSNIEPEFLKGDQRKYFTPCPCCGESIVWEWQIESEYSPGEMAGITWALDENNRLIDESVGYTCQKCGGFFDDRNKMELINAGEWVPTATPSEPGYYSYHISSLIAPTSMFGWLEYVRQFLEAHPPDQPPIDSKMKTFVNLVLGQTYKAEAVSIESGKLMNNARPYEIGVFPDELSINDGNGPIVMLTLGSDLNGKEDDARLDYEIIAHAANGQTYSVEHGSIGTFIPKDPAPDLRAHWTYRRDAERSVWPSFQKIVDRIYKSDNGKRQMPLFYCGIDVGHMSKYAWPFINDNDKCIGLKGDDDLKYISQYLDSKTYKPSNENPKLFLVKTNKTKDNLMIDMDLNWNRDVSQLQPVGFMNFPESDGLRYLKANFYDHFEAEEKKLDNKGNFRWLKKPGNPQNHLYDCRLYGIVARDIFLDQKIFKPLKISNGTFADFVKKLGI